MIKPRWIVEHRDIDGQIIGRETFLFRRSARRYAHSMGGFVSYDYLAYLSDMIASPGVSYSIGGTIPTYSTELRRLRKSEQ